MNIVLWTLQILLALHTALGGLWKFSNPVQTMVPSLAALPPNAWLALGVAELVLAGALIIPVFNKAWSVLVPVAALVIAAEMLLFCALHFASGAKFDGQVIYWLVVAAVCAFIAWGRRTQRPL